MNDIQFNIAAHWLPINEKQGRVEKDTLIVKISGINFHVEPNSSEWGICTGYIKNAPDNINDNNAIAFYKSDGKLIGYVQKELQNYVNKFTGERELDCIIAISPFFTSDGKVKNKAYATILKFFENDIDYATEMINTITEDAGQNTLIDIQHFQNKLSSSSSNNHVDATNDEERAENVAFRYDEFYKFQKDEKTGKKSFDTLSIKIENADWFFDRKTWKAGVFSGYCDKLSLKEYSNEYGIYRDDNSLVGWASSFDFDEVIRNFSEGHRIYCIFSLVPHIDTKTNCIEIKGKAVLLKFFEEERDYALKLFEETRIRLANNAIKDYKTFNEKKAEKESCGEQVYLSWGFDTKRYNFGQTNLIYLEDSGQPQKKGCLPLFAIVLFVVLSIIM